MNNILTGRLTSRGNLIGNVNTIVYAHNYNDLTNKPQINNVTLQGNKTASDLGLATPSDITVTSVNEQTGDVVLTGSDIDYSEDMTLNAKINDLESQIIASGVQSVNGLTGNVTLTSNNIEYSTGVTIKNKIDAVEQSIPVVDYPVTSVNGETGAVVLDGDDIEYSEGVSVNSKINAVEQSIPVVNYPVTSVNGETGAVVLAGSDIEFSAGVTVNDQINTVDGKTTTNATAIGDLSTLTTSVTSSLVGAVNSLDTDKADKTLIDDIIKIKYFTLLAANVTRNMDLSSNVSLDSGYKFLCYLPSILPDGFTTDQYLWLSAPTNIQGNPWWNTNPISGAGTGTKLRFYYLEIRDV